MGDGLRLSLDSEGHTPLFCNTRSVNESNRLLHHEGEQSTDCCHPQNVNVLSVQLTASGDLNSGRSALQQTTSNQTQLTSQLEPQGHLFANSATGNVDGIRDELASQCQQYGLSDIGTGAVLSLNGGGAQVRSTNSFRQAKQRGIRARLGRVHIEASTADVASLDRVGKRLLVDETAAGSVDDDLALLGLAQELSIEHASGFLGLRQVDGHEISASHQVFQLNQLNTELSSTGRVRVRIVRNDVGLKSSETLRKQLADVTETDDTDGLAEDFDTLEGRALPLPLTQGRVRSRQLASGGQQQRDCVLTCRVNIGGRSVDNHDAALGSGIDVDVIQANAGTADDLQIRSRFEDFLIHGGSRADEQCVSVTNRSQELSAVRTIYPTDLNGIPQCVHCGLCQLVGDEDNGASVLAHKHLLVCLEKFMQYVRCHLRKLLKRARALRLIINSGGEARGYLPKQNGAYYPLFRE